MKKVSRKVAELENTYRDEHPRLLSFIRSKVRSSEEAEDILQDVFIQAVQNFSATEPIENLLGWIYTIARNRIIDWYRKKRLPKVDVVDEEGVDLLEDLIGDLGISLEDDFIRKFLSEALIESIDELPEEQRDIFILQVVEGRTFREIAEMLDISINTAMARKRYAVLRLRRRLAQIKAVLEEN